MVVVREYCTIKYKAKVCFVEKKSEFIGYAAPVTDEKSALTFLENIRSLHRRANHNVFAYSIRKNNIVRYSDDREPQGTAGLPVLNFLKKNEITDVIVVITRYFGGTLLGTGGLVRAYTQTTKLTIEKAQKITIRYFTNVHIKCAYEHYGKISNILSGENAVIDNEDFSDSVNIKCHILDNNYESICEKINEITGGKVLIEKISTNFYPVVKH